MILVHEMKSFGYVNKLVITQDNSLKNVILYTCYYYVLFVYSLVVWKGSVAYHTDQNDVIDNQAG